MGIGILKRTHNKSRQSLRWDDPNMIEVQARSSDEARSLDIARHRGRYWSAVVTYRTDKIRVISVRRSRKAEVELYES